MATTTKKSPTSTGVIAWPQAAHLGAKTLKIQEKTEYNEI